MELADTRDLKSLEHHARSGSNPEPAISRILRSRAMAKKNQPIGSILSVAQVNMSNALTDLLKAIDICENDKGDERYDMLHEIKNKLMGARKRLKILINQE